MSEEPAEEEPMEVPVEPEPDGPHVEGRTVMTFFMGLAEGISESLDVGLRQNLKDEKTRLNALLIGMLLQVMQKLQSMKKYTKKIKKL